MPRFLVRHLAAAEAQGNLDLVAFVEEAAHRLHFGVVVMVVDGRAHLDLLDLDDLLLLARLVGLLLLFVLVLAVVHQLDHGRFRFWRDLDQVEAFFFGDCAGFIDADRAVFVAVISDQKDGAREDLLIDTWPILGGCLVGLLETSGYYDFSPVLNPHENAFCEDLAYASQTRFGSGPWANVLYELRGRLLAL